MAAKTETVGNTIYNLDSDRIDLELGSSTFGNATYPNATVKYAKNEKTLVNYSVTLPDIRASRWFKGKFDNDTDAKRTLVINFEKENKLFPDYVKYFQDLTTSINEKVGPHKRALGLAKDYIIPNPLILDETNKNYKLWCAVNTNPQPVTIKTKKGKDISVEHYRVNLLANMAKVNIKRLGTHGFKGNVSELKFELRGKNGKMTIHTHIYGAVAYDLFEDTRSVAEDVRNDMLKERGLPSQEEIDRLTKLASGDDLEDDDEKEKFSIRMEDKKDSPPADANTNSSEDESKQTDTSQRTVKKFNAKDAYA